ncbi:MAG: nucleotidyltransferase domain-containing protein [Verrucomicrobia bacterium]|nr:nucleotidyltransferase domain-containing protein [Verrucomicrobiota bacterium]
MSGVTEAGIREAIQSAFRGRPVKRVELFGSSARGEMTPDSNVDILVTPTPEAARHDLCVIAAEVEDALGRPVDFLTPSDVGAMKNIQARDLILGSAVAVYVP